MLKTQMCEARAVRDYIHALVGTAEEIVRENQLLQKEVDRLTGRYQIYEKHF